MPHQSTEPVDTSRRFPTILSLTVRKTRLFRDVREASLDAATRRMQANLDMNRLSRYRTIIVLLSVIVVSMVGCQRKQLEPSSKRKEINVDVCIAFHGRRDDVAEKINLSLSATALDALRETAKRNNIEVQIKGTGETAFVISVGGVENLGAKGDNWTYRVNDQLGDRSSGVFNLQDGDKVTWMFGKYPLVP